MTQYFYPYRLVMAFLSNSDPNMEKKLIFVIGSLQLGGAERHLVSLLPLLKSRGWSVQLITLTEKGLLASDLEKVGIPVCCILNDWHTKINHYLPPFLGRPLRIFLSILRLSLILRKEKNAHLHFFLPEAYVLGMISAKLARFPGHKIMSRRSLNHYQQRRPMLAWLESKLHAKTSMITGNCLAVVTQLRVDEKVPEECLKLIYNGIDTSLYISHDARSTIRKNLNIQNDALVFIIVANLIPYKGHRDLLEALNQIKDRLPSNWRLICVGKDRDDGVARALQQQAEKFHLKEHILWLGSRRDIPDLLAAADIGILCSREEGFSNAILEMMASGLAMVVTDVGGNKEAVIDGITGYVVSPKDSVALSAALLALAENPEKVLLFGQQARLRVSEYFSIETCVKAYEDLYESLA